MEVKSCHSYAGRLSFQFWNPIQSEYYVRIRFLSKEVIDMGHFKCEEEETEIISGEYILSRLLFFYLWLMC